MNKKRAIEILKVFSTIFFVGILSCAIPWLHFGVLAGFIPVLINSTMLSILYFSIHQES